MMVLLQYVEALCQGHKLTNDKLLVKPREGYKVETRTTARRLNVKS